MLLCCGCFGRTWCTLGSQPPLEKRPSKTSWFCSQMMYMSSISQQRGAGYLSVQAVIIRSLKSFDQSPTSIHLMKTLGCHTSDFCPSVFFVQHPNPNSRLFHSKHLVQPFARTETYFHSFFVDSVKLWNSLPNDWVNCSSVLSFKNSIKLPYLSVS